MTSERPVVFLYQLPQSPSEPSLRFARWDEDCVAFRFCGSPSQISTRSVMWLVFDLGTSGVKAAVLDSDGKIVRSAVEPPDSYCQRLRRRAGSERRVARAGRGCSRRRRGCDQDSARWPDARSDPAE
jgi:hypothetical protein